MAGMCLLNEDSARAEPLAILYDIAVAPKSTKEFALRWTPEAGNANFQPGPERVVPNVRTAAMLQRVGTPWGVTKPLRIKTVNDKTALELTLRVGPAVAELLKAHDARVRAFITSHPILAKITDTTKIVADATYAGIVRDVEPRSGAPAYATINVNIKGWGAAYQPETKSFAGVDATSAAGIKMAEGVDATRFAIVKRGTESGTKNISWTIKDEASGVERLVGPQDLQPNKLKTSVVIDRPTLDSYRPADGGVRITGQVWATIVYILADEKDDEGAADRAAYTAAKEAAAKASGGDAGGASTSAPASSFAAWTPTMDTAVKRRKVADEYV
jgi:hypothetical protein